jgi:hypothetical protein
MRRNWTPDEVAKLKSLAGKMPAAKVASDLGRGLSATMVKAHQLRVSMKYRPERAANYDPERSGMDGLLEGG